MENLLPSKRKFFNKLWLAPLGAGVAIGLFCAFLSALGNPVNMQLCVACFLRDTAGALGLHSNPAVMFIRPEIIGIVLGACILSLVLKEHTARGGSSPFIRFILGVTVMVGAMIFLGCPTRMILRIAGGDLNALIALPGFVLGVATGVFFLSKGFTLNRNHPQRKLEGFAFPFVNLILLVLLFISIFIPSLLAFSTVGVGSVHAPIWASLIAGLIVGAIGFKTRLCFISGIRDAILFKQFHGLIAFGALLVTVLISNLIMPNLSFGGGFSLSMADQPVAHTNVIWNILGLFLVGFASCLLGGCPFRQLVMAGSGNTDSAFAVLGLLAGGALVHNFSIASSPAGVTTNGKIAFAVCLVIVLIIAITNTKSLKRTFTNIFSRNKKIGDDTKTTKEVA